MNEPRHPDALRTHDAFAAPVVRDLAGLLDALRASAAKRDREGGHAAQEKQWIADAGLLTLAVPREFGGARRALARRSIETIRTIARVDSALAHLLGLHLPAGGQRQRMGQSRSSARAICAAPSSTAGGGATR